MAAMERSADREEGRGREQNSRKPPAVIPWLIIAILFPAMQAIATSADGGEVGIAKTPAGNSLPSAPSADGSPVKVTIAMVLLNITDIDEVEQRFHVNGYLFMKWRDPRLKHARAPAQFEPVSYAKGEIWSPTVEVVNAVDPRQSVDFKLRADVNGLVTYTERFSVSVTSRFALRSFPFDSQILNIAARPYVGDKNIFSLIADTHLSRTVPEFRLYSSLASWEVGPLGALVTTVEASDGGPISEARFQLSLKRKFEFYVWKVILPLLLMVSLSWAVFWVEAGDLATQVQIAVTTVLTIIAFAFAISGSLPRVSYLTFIDAFFLTCYLFVFIAIAELMSVHVSHRTRGTELAERIRRQSRWFVPVAFVVANTLLLVFFRII